MIIVIALSESHFVNNFRLKGNFAYLIVRKVAKSDFEKLLFSKKGDFRAWSLVQKHFGYFENFFQFFVFKQNSVLLIALSKLHTLEKLFSCF